VVGVVAVVEREFAVVDGAADHVLVGVPRMLRGVGVGRPP
jgi:hypothetical protein